MNNSLRNILVFFNRALPLAWGRFMEDINKKILWLLTTWIIPFYLMFCSVMNFDWYFNTWQPKAMVKRFGRNGARVLYFMTGLLLIVLTKIVRFYVLDS